MVSVIIPTYSRPKNLKRAISSVLNQTIKEIEIIVVDDNNPDSTFRTQTEKVMNEFSGFSNVKYIKHEKNKNGAAARNTGIRYSKGEFITFLDDDDYFCPKRIESILAVADTNFQYDCYYTNVAIVEKGMITGIRQNSIPNNILFDTLVHNTCWVTGSNLFFRKTAIDKIGMFDETFRRHQDTEYMVRFILNGLRICHINEVLVVKNQDDRINEVNIDEQIKIKNQFIEKFVDDIPQPNRNEVYYSNYLIILWQSIGNKSQIGTEEIIKQIQQYGPITWKLKTMIFLRNIYVTWKLQGIKRWISNLEAMHQIRKLNLDYLLKLVNEMESFQ